MLLQVMSNIIFQNNNLTGKAIERYIGRIFTKKITVFLNIKKSKQNALRQKLHSGVDFAVIYYIMKI